VSLLLDKIFSELKNIYQFLCRNRNEAIVLTTAAVCLYLFKYHPLWNDWSGTFIYYGLIPLAVIFILRKNPLDFGFRIGNVKLWGTYVVVTCIVFFFILLAFSHNPVFQSYYHVNKFNLLSYSLVNIVSLSASEFLFRGFLLFGLKEKFKEATIFIQMLPFVMVHFGKPDLETLSTVLTGIYFGYIVYRGNSYWPAFLIHVFINIGFVAMVNH
jgi:membrane protease YdiL (CAAX protease family)